MALVITTINSSGVDLVGKGGNGGAVATWENTLGRDALITARIQMSSLNGSAADYSVFRLLESINYPVYSDGTTRNVWEKKNDGDSSQNLEIPQTLVKNGETLVISVFSTNASDSSVTIATEIIDTQAGIDVRAVAGATPTDGDAIPKYALQTTATEVDQFLYTLANDDGLVAGMTAIFTTDEGDEPRLITVFDGGTNNITIENSLTGSFTNGNAVKLLPQYTQLSPDVNVTQISGSTAAANNIETTYVSNSMSISSAGRVEADVKLFSGNSAQNTVLGTADETHRTIVAAVSAISTVGSVPGLR